MFLQSTPTYKWFEEIVQKLVLRPDSDTFAAASLSNLSGLPSETIGLRKKVLLQEKL